MDSKRLCMGCMTEKGSVEICPQCGYDEKEPIGPLVLPPRTQLMNGYYLVGRVLGKPGGFGITYLAWDVKLEKKVAIKEFLPCDLVGRDKDHTTVMPHHTDDKELFKYGFDRFVHEARTLAKLDHPNIVRVLSFFEENGTAYLVMDYYVGVSLAQYLEDNGGRIDEKLAIDIMMPIMDGLCEVHEKGFLHRDIKPQNIYLTEGGVPILLDFGAARFAMGERSRSLSVVITPGFAPFEQYQRRGNQGVWTDIYSCGATLYFMLTGGVPPLASDRITNDELVKPEKLVSGISSYVSDAVMKALSMNIEKRPQSVREFQDMFVEPIMSNSITLSLTKPKKVKKMSITIVLGGIILILVVIIFMLMLGKDIKKPEPYYRRVNPPPERITEEEKSRWVFSDSDKRYLTYDDIKYLSNDELWRARNEIYARRGYIFKTSKGKTYAKSLGNSYCGKEPDASIVYRNFNRFEKYNIDFIKKHEKRR